MKLKDLKQGDFFKRKQDAKTVYVKHHYDRASKTFSCSDIEDMNREIFLKSNVEVFIDFEY